MKVPEWVIKLEKLMEEAEREEVKIKQALFSELLRSAKERKVE